MQWLSALIVGELNAGNRNRQSMSSGFARKRGVVFFDMQTAVQAVFAARFCRVGRRLIPSVFSRMNQLRCAVADAHVRQRADVRRDGSAEPVPRAWGHDFSGARMLSNGPPQAICSGRRARRLQSSTVHFSTMKHLFAEPLHEAPRAAFVRLFQHCFAAFKDRQQAADGHRDTFLKQKMRSPATRPRVAAGMRRATIGGITHGMPLATLDAPASGRPDASKMGAANSSISSRGNSDEDQKQQLDSRNPCAPVG
ncbi:hypothetical protein [Burkholderia sp. SIMBA_062]|uniref:hypothetical protein n=1 Tax=Burkholderia sp. SIMBA_062 TaxID=3085803 RepID=UPI00397A8A99